MNIRTPNRAVVAAVLAASIGYAVDLFNGFLLPALRVPCLHDLGVPSALSLEVGTNIFNLQLLGQTLGAILLWGPLADRRGRQNAMFLSIILYGLASIVSGFSHTIPVFACSRFIAGMGLGGQLGAGIALISESITEPRYRTIGTTVVGTLGMLGVIAAGFLAKTPVNWRVDYFIGGVLALLPLLFSFATRESQLFKEGLAENRRSYWAAFGYLMKPAQLMKLAECTLIGAPVFFVIGLLVSGAPEFGAALGMRIKPTSAEALVWTYVSIALGNLLSGFITPLFQSRKLAIMLFHFITGIGVTMLLLVPAISPSGYYWRCALTGLGIGSWSNMVTNAAEQWGTNVRGLVTITVPNFIRLLLFPISAVLTWLKPTMGFIHAATMVGFTCIGTAMVFTFLVKDGYEKSLAYCEPIPVQVPNTNMAE